MVRVVQLLVALICVFMGKAVFAEDASTSFKGMEDRIQSLKKEVLELSRELSILEEELLYPSSTEIVVFVGMDQNNEWMPDSIRLEIDGHPLASHIYTKRETRVMREGGVQRLYQGNVREGEHKLIVVVQGKAPSSKNAYKEMIEYEFEKENSPNFLEIHLSEGEDGLTISTKEWD